VAGFDTHQVVKSLKAVGFTEEQAEAVTQAVRDSQNVELSNLATNADLLGTKAALKADMAEVKAELKADMAAVRAELKADIAEVKAELAEVNAELKADIAKVRTEMVEIKVDLVKWMVGVGFAQAGLVLTILRFMR
jgi:chromosome segregation ATPase